MPIYDYTCPECGNEEELLVKYDHRDEQKCSQCGNFSDRTEIGVSTVKADSRYEMKALTKDGPVKGNFGSGRKRKLGWM